jgi:hypothetical protein
VEGPLQERAAEKTCGCSVRPLLIAAVVVELVRVDRDNLIQGWEPEDRSS